MSRKLYCFVISFVIVLFCTGFFVACGTDGQEGQNSGMGSDADFHAPELAEAPETDSENDENRDELANQAQDTEANSSPNNGVDSSGSTNNANTNGNSNKDTNTKTNTNTNTNTNKRTGSDSNTSNTNNPNSSAKSAQNTVPAAGFAASTSQTREDLVVEVVRLVNVERSQMGLAPVTEDETLSMAAQIRANEILELFDHTRPNGQSCFSLLTEYKIRYSACAENIAKGYDSPEKVMKGWMDSDGHKTNILGSYTKIGVGVDEWRSSNGVTYYVWTQFFIK
ncbi:MAG: CAP domain-containing protein [Peptococcaceae bacterium]|nr:CAP domain-containing protein [Peptococcaceae bacterium]